MTPSATFQAWRSEILGELTEKREQLAAAEATLVEKEMALAAAISDRQALAVELARLETTTTDYRFGGTTKAEVSVPLRRRQNYTNDEVKQAERLVIQARFPVEECRRQIAELETGLQQLDQLEQPASVEAEPAA